MGNDDAPQKQRQEAMIKAYRLGIEIKRGSVDQTAMNALKTKSWRCGRATDQSRTDDKSNNYNQISLSLSQSRA